MSTAIKPTPIENEQLPNSRRIYIDGKQPACACPFAKSIKTQLAISKTSWKKIRRCVSMTPAVHTAIRRDDGRA